MTSTIERLELPSEAYDVLQQRAQAKGCEPDEYLPRLLYREKKKDELFEQLEQEYQQLIDRDLARTMTEEESNRLETVIARLNLIEELSDNYRLREQRAIEIDQKFPDLEN